MSLLFYVVKLEFYLGMLNLQYHRVLYNVHVPLAILNGCMHSISVVSNSWVASVIDMQHNILQVQSMLWSYINTICVPRPIWHRFICKLPGLNQASIDLHLYTGQKMVKTRTMDKHLFNGKLFILPILCSYYVTFCHKTVSVTLPRIILWTSTAFFFQFCLISQK